MKHITNEQREAIVRKAIAERDALLTDEKIVELARDHKISATETHGSSIAMGVVTKPELLSFARAIEAALSQPAQEQIKALEAKVASLTREAYDWWTAAASAPTAGAIAYQLTKRMVIDMQTARAAVDAAMECGSWRALVSMDSAQSAWLAVAPDDLHHIRDTLDRNITLDADGEPEGGWDAIAVEMVKFIDRITHGITNSPPA